MHNWEASRICVSSKVRKKGCWVSLCSGALKFNVDGAAREKPGLAGVSGVLRNSEGAVMALFSRHVGCIESNEAEVVAILEALWMFVSSF